MYVYVERLPSSCYGVPSCTSLLVGELTTPHSGVYTHILTKVYTHTWMLLIISSSTHVHVCVLFPACIIVLQRWALRNVLIHPSSLPPPLFELLKGLTRSHNSLWMCVGLCNLSLSLSLFLPPPFPLLHSFTHTTRLGSYSVGLPITASSVSFTQYKQNCCLIKIF